MERSAQRIMPECRCAMRKFSRQGREGFVESGYFDKIQELRKSTNMDVWVVGTLNQSFIKRFLT